MINENMIADIVKKVLEEVDNLPNSTNGSDSTNVSDGIFPTIEEAIEAAYQAKKEFSKYSMADKERFIKSIRKKLLKEENLQLLSKMAVEETSMGNYEHKIYKNKLAAETTPGTEDLVTQAMAGDDGLTLLELSPFGVITSITPTTNASETIICNAIGMIASGNTVVFCPHPRALQTSLTTIKLINEALAEVGAPKNLLVCTNTASMENTKTAMNHPKINMIVATGGPGLVKAALSCGKKAIGAGAGNPPVVVDETADIEKAAKDIIDGCSFDNNLPCIAEKEIIAVDSIADYLIYNMKLNGGYNLTDKDKVEELKNLVTNEKGLPKSNFVGKSAKYLLEQIGITVSDDIRVIFMETSKDHLFVVEELMMPILPLVRVANVDEAIDLAVKVENGNRHTAIMHSKNVDKLSKMGREIQTTIFVKNGPSYNGIGYGGEGYSTFTIAGPTGEGLTSAKSFTRKRRCVLVDGFNIR